MNCHILFSEKNKKNISKCRLLKILPRVLSVKEENYNPRSDAVPNKMDIILPYFHRKHAL